MMNPGGNNIILGFIKSIEFQNVHIKKSIVDLDSLDTLK